jgi:hypothetical protein
MLGTPVLGRLRQENCEFKASLGYKVKSVSKKRKKEKKEEKKKTDSSLLNFIFAAIYKIN